VDEKRDLGGAGRPPDPFTANTWRFLLRLRNFFVYACAFVGAAWFGLYAYNVGMEGSLITIVAASVFVAVLFAFRT
jgi:hypothetical protein